MPVSDNKNVQARHAGHFDTYWSVFLVGTAIEVACLFIVRADMFTLVVCLKTMACTAAWLGTSVENSGSGSSSGSGGRARSSGGGSGKNGEGKDGKSSRQSSVSPSSTPTDIAFTHHRMELTPLRTG